MTQFDCQDGSNRSGMLTFHGILVGSPARDGWLTQDSRTCEGDSWLFCNADVNPNVVGLTTDCTGEFDPVAGMSVSAAMLGECDFVTATCVGPRTR